MSRKICVTTLVENTVGRLDLLAEHGLAFWIEAGEKLVLFDTGAGQVITRNARSLGVSLEPIDAVVLSHGHYDHTGGLRHVLKTGGRTKVFAHPDAFRAKYARNTDGAPRNVGIKPSDEAAIRENADELVRTDQPVEVLPGLFVTGKVPRVTDFEDTGGPFFLDSQCQKPDPLIDDQAMFFESDRGTVVLLGCAHSGVVNTLQYIRQLTGNKPIHAVMGGMHLINASERRIERTIDAIGRLEVKRLGPAHCTGIAATARVWSAFPGGCFPCNTGSRAEFEALESRETR